MGPNAEGGRDPTSASDGGPESDGNGRVHEPPLSVTIRTAVESDAPAVARLHAEQISEGFLSFLGRRFLVRLYRRIVRHPDSFLLVAESRGQAEGFIAGSTDVRGLYRQFVVRDGIPAACAAAPRLIVRWRQVVETLGHGTSDGIAAGDGSGLGAELLSVAVAPDRQGRGLGRRLVASFLRELEGRSCPSAHVVVGAGNVGAIALYERCGFVIAERFELHAGTPSLLMRWDGPTSASESESS
jgi:ribosomal protein S18 acetylase RimI-like enzyme